MNEKKCIEYNKDLFACLKERVSAISGINISSSKDISIISKIVHCGNSEDVNQINSFLHHLTLCPVDHPDLQKFIDLVTTNKTYFFREDRHFNYLIDTFVPSFRDKNKDQKPLRIWSAACSTGEEVYSIAILLVDKFGPSFPFEVHGTDINSEVISLAKNGVYPHERLKSMSHKFQKNAFDFGEERISQWVKIKDQYKKNTSFKILNLMDSNYPWKNYFDIIFCRNVMIYFSPNTIRNISQKFYEAASAEACLFTGLTEPISKMKTSWEQIEPSIYVKNSRELQNIPLRKEDIKRVDQVKSPKSRVLVVDDSKSMRRLLVKIISDHPNLEVVGEASNPIVADALLEKLKVDVITLDLNMPRMDGLSYIRDLMPRNPIPIIIISSLSSSKGNLLFDCLEAGAIDYLKKPELSHLLNDKKAIGDRIYNTSKASIKIFKKIPYGKIEESIPSDIDLIVLGASTGGTSAITEVLRNLPKTVPPIAIVQHISSGFSANFANRLNEICDLTVCEAKNKDLLTPGLVVIAPGNKHMELVKKGSKIIVQLNESCKVNNHRPSVDVLFNSVAKLDNKVLAIILTGMGKDGSMGLQALKNKGAITVAQDEESSVVFGMPRAAVELGVVDKVLPLEKIGEFVARGPKK